jgi:hypothetical protein
LEAGTKIWDILGLTTIKIDATVSSEASTKLPIGLDFKITEECVEHASAVHQKLQLCLI